MSVVSFIVTFYQQSAFIEEAVRSALEQNFDGIEVIAVDDGSTDGGSDLVRNIRDPRLKLIVQENSGPSLAANTAIEAARGEYIALLGGDDIALPNRIARQYDLVSRGYTDILFDVPLLINENGLLLNDIAYPIFSNLNANHHQKVSFERLFLHGNYLCAPSVFMRRSIFQRVGLFSPGLIQLQDLDYWIRCLRCGLNLDIVSSRLTAYRRRNNDSNLSSEENMSRILIEEGYIMRHVFDNMDMKSLNRHFARYVPSHLTEDPGDIAIAKALLYLRHHRRVVSEIAYEMLIGALQRDPSIRERAASVGLTMPTIFREMLYRNPPVGRY